MREQEADVKMVGTLYAAKRLGVSKTAVRNMVQRGELRDHGHTREGGVRHETRLERSEVVEFAKNHHRLGRRWVPVTNALVPAQKSTPVKRTAVVEARTEVSAEPTGPGRLFQRLAQIEAKLDRLLKVWG
jgi:hypothetical protein